MKEKHRCRMCGGRVDSLREQVESTCHWKCSECGYNQAIRPGVIPHWVSIDKPMKEHYWCKECNASVKRVDHPSHVLWECLNDVCGSAARIHPPTLKVIPDWVYKNEPSKPISPKAPYELADLEFLAAMCECYQKGIKGDRKANGWKTMPWDDTVKAQYVAKVIRHLAGVIYADNATAAKENAAAIACNANILWRRISD